MKHILLSILAMTLAFSAGAQQKPKKLPILEEQTGLMCGWCPVGYAYLNQVADEIPESVIVSYHNIAQGDDPMAMKMGYADYYMGDGNPWGAIDRSNSFGFGPTTDVVGMYRAAMEEETPVEIALYPVWEDEEQTTVLVRSNVYFRSKPQNGFYRIGFILVQDGMCDPTWKQMNNCRNATAYSHIPGMDVFINGGATVSGLVYNHIAVAISTGYAGIVDSLPMGDDAELNTPYYNEYRFPLSACLNKKNRSLIQNKENLHVVAFVVRGTSFSSSSGAAVNAAKANIADFGTDSVDQMAAEKTVIAESYFDLSGRKINNPENGIYIRVDKLSDGTSKAQKIIIRK